MITDIQRFSLKDGPGIRTTVFFKGCNMDCDWCHNPEAISYTPELMCYPQKCIGCGACGKDKDAPCFSGARVRAGREASAEDVMDEVLQDIDYYAASGGGVTLSGGEVMTQFNFAAELLRACHEKKLHTAIETNLFYEYSLLESVLGYLDLAMCDLKLMDAEKHRKHTGADNGLILKNIRRLSRSGVKYILRTPVIPGVNDNQKDIGDIADFIAGLEQKPLYYELLNYNPLGVSKYTAMGLASRYAEAMPVSESGMLELAAAARRGGLDVRIG